jgi:hypothetical protein
VLRTISTTCAPQSWNPSRHDSPTRIEPEKLLAPNDESLNRVRNILQGAAAAGLGALAWTSGFDMGRVVGTLAAATFVLVADQVSLRFPIHILDFKMAVRPHKLVIIVCIMLGAQPLLSSPPASSRLSPSQPYPSPAPPRGLHLRINV